MRLNMFRAMVVSAAVMVVVTTALTAQSGPTARQVIERIQHEIGAPARADTVDTIKAGDPETRVTGIATTFTPSLDVLKRAVAANANLIVTHEPTFYNHLDRTDAFETDSVFAEKQAYIRDHHLVIWRFHDLLHFRNPDATVQAISEKMGWTRYRKPNEQGVFVLPSTTLSVLAADLQRRLDARVVRVIGDPELPVTKVGLMPGAAPEEMQVKALERDDIEVLVAGESREWETVEYTRDAVLEGRHKALILLGHVISEEPGMEVAARWLRTLFPAINAQFIPAREPFWTPSGTSARSVSGYDPAVQTQSTDLPRLTVKPTADFDVTGTGANPAWEKAEWTALRRRQADGLPYDSRFKVLYSTTGLYVFMDATDRKLTATMSEDFMDLWHEDVFEVFLWTDERYPVYFEYEISPLNRELAILVPNFGGHFLGWRPWHYERDRVIRKATNTVGGPREPNAAIQGWRAEFFFPYALLDPLQNVPPKPGTRWRANFYRMDYDNGPRPTQWEWARVGQTFHEYQKFGELLFAER